MLGHLWCQRVPRLAACAVHPGVLLSVEELAAVCSQASSVVFVTTPSFLEKALSHPDFASLRGRLAGIVVSGGALREKTARAVAEALGVWTLEIYGSTEAGTVAWRRQDAGERYTLQAGVSATLDATGALVVDSPYAMTRPFTMSDAAAFVAPRQFRLLGRLDRQVKVLEEFVSLPAVEAAFARHPLVEAVRVEVCGEDVARLGALVVLSADGRDALAKGTYAALSATLRRELLTVLGERAFPRRIRFVRELPVDARGKTTASNARAALAAWCREPVVCDWSTTADRLFGDLGLSARLRLLQGAFSRLSPPARRGPAVLLAPLRAAGLSRFSRDGGLPKAQVQKTCLAVGCRDGARDARGRGTLLVCA